MLIPSLVVLVHKVRMLYDFVSIKKKDLVVWSSFKKPVQWCESQMIHESFWTHPSNLTKHFSPIRLYFFLILISWEANCSLANYREEITAYKCCAMQISGQRCLAADIILLTCILLSNLKYTALDLARFRKMTWSASLVNRLQVK